MKKLTVRNPLCHYAVIIDSSTKYKMVRVWLPGPIKHSLSLRFSVALSRVENHNLFLSIECSQWCMNTSGFVTKISTSEKLTCSITYLGVRFATFELWVRFPHLILLRKYRWSSFHSETTLILQ